MTTALVTGGSGFIGGHLVERLVERGTYVRCLVRRSSQTQLLERLGVELIYGDLSDAASLEAAVAGVDVVYHTAAMIAAFTAEEMLRANALGTHHVVAACAAQENPPTLVHLSSLAAAGTAMGERPRRESDRPSPISHYGRSKRASERAAERLAGRVPITILRPGIVFGPRGKDLLQMFRPVAQFGLHAVPQFSTGRLSLVYVEDLVEVMICAAEQGERIPGSQHVESNGADSGRGVYFVCDREHPNYAELGRMIAAAGGRERLCVLYLPEPFIWLAAAGAQLADRFRGTAGTFNVDKIREATAGHWVADPGKAEQQLDFAPPQSLVQRLRETADWYRAEKWL